MEKDLVLAYKEVFKGETAKKVLEDLEKFCLYNSSSFTGDANSTIFNEGRRVVYLHIKKLIELELEDNPIQEYTQEIDF